MLFPHLLTPLRHHLMPSNHILRPLHRPLIHNRHPINAPHHILTLPVAFMRLFGALTLFPCS